MIMMMNDTYLALAFVLAFVYLFLFILVFVFVYAYRVVLCLFSLVHGLAARGD